jgi:hypothetical protein
MSAGQMRQSPPLTPNLYLIALLTRHANRSSSALMVSDKVAMISIGVLAFG